MDYTNNPEANMFPGRYNFEFLQEMYGTVPGSAQPEVALEESVRGDDRRLYRAAQQQREEIPEWVMEKWRALDDELDRHSQGAERRAGGGWRVLEETPHAESHELDIGHGYKIQVHKLLEV